MASLLTCQGKALYFFHFLYFLKLSSPLLDISHFYHCYIRYTSILLYTNFLSCQACQRSTIKDQDNLNNLTEPKYFTWNMQFKLSAANLLYCVCILLLDIFYFKNECFNLLHFIMSILIHNVCLIYNVFNSCAECLYVKNYRWKVTLC